MPKMSSAKNRKTVARKRYFTSRKSKSQAAVVPKKPGHKPAKKTLKSNQESTVSIALNQSIADDAPTPSVAPTSPASILAPEPETESVIESPLVQNPDQLSEINQLIQQATQRLQELTDQTHTHADVVDEKQSEPETVTEFNGTQGDDEIKLLQAELDARRRAETKLKRELDQLKQEYEAEKDELQHTIKKLQKEMHRTAPIAEHKFFTLSQELNEAVTAIAKLADESTPLAQIPAPTVTTPPTTPATVSSPTPAATPPPTSPVEPKQVVSQPTIQEAKPAAAPVEADKPEEEIKKAKKKKHKKMLITGGAAVIILIALSTGLSWKLTSEPEVDEELVSQYLQNSTEKAGEVQGVTTQTETPTTTDAHLSNSGSVPGAVASDQDKYKESQAEVPFANSIWEKIKDPLFGVEMEYPINAVNIIKTDSSLTFIRKTGYIFKVARVETGLDAMDYWRQIQATSLNYQPEEVTLGDKPAVHLVLQDTIDYPGNRYLVKTEDFLYDIWYATDGPKFTTDDVARAKYMLDSVTLTD